MIVEVTGKIIDVTGSLVVQERVREWCKLPYPNHPRGCPKYNHSEECPPKAKHVQEVFDLYQQHWFAVEAFDLSRQTRVMAERHPEWSERQCRCCLYWQGGVRKRLRETCERLVNELPGFIYTLNPEAMGVNVFRTAHRHGLMIRKNPEIVHKIALIGRTILKTREDHEKTKSSFL
jgi:predicted metal-binding protein